MFRSYKKNYNITTFYLLNTKYNKIKVIVVASAAVRKIKRKKKTKLRIIFLHLYNAARLIFSKRFFRFSISSEVMSFSNVDETSCFSGSRLTEALDRTAGSIYNKKITNKLKQNKQI